MASTNFTTGTTIASAWLNDVNTATYTTIPGITAGTIPVPVQDNSVTSAKLTAGAAVSNIGAGGITATQLASSSVTPSKLANSGNELGLRNRIINGAMMIDQRNKGNTITPATYQYCVDRWYVDCSTTGKYTIGQNAGGVTPPTGFKNYVGITVTSAYNITSSDNHALTQYIEGNNIADLNFGTGTAKTVTLSFWVYSSLTGTFSGALKNSTRSYTFSYSISSANTWTQVAITIPGDTAGTWVTDSSGALSVVFSFGTGSTYTTAAGTWTSGYYLGTPGSTSLLGTLGAYFYVTGVQLEKGSTQTPFEFRPYGFELSLCQRYYEKLGNSANDIACIQAVYTSGAYIGTYVPWKVTKRASPTMTISSGWSVFGCGQPTVFSWGVSGSYISAQSTGASVGANFYSSSSTYLIADAEV
jgi:hypothetical protein